MTAFLLTKIKNNRRTAFLLVMAMLPLQQVVAHDPTPISLKGVKMPTTPGLLDGKAPIVINKTAAIQLGKALFWDINVGSDGMACASCHFHAGADGRVINQLSTGALHAKAKTSTTFQHTATGGVGGVNYKIRVSDFPFYQLTDPTNRDSKVVFSTDDVFSSAGVFLRSFKQANASDTVHDDCTSKDDSIYHIGDLNARQSQARHTPSVINAGFNFRNFWDGRANNIFNGVSPYGARDTNARIWVVQPDGTVRKQLLRLENASLASQATAPAISNSEMSCSNRKFPDIARKIFKLRPLAKQHVHVQDSVLAGLRLSNSKGLKTTYEALIKKSFATRYWSGKGQFGQATGKAAPAYNQMEANFSLFFGVALQLYEQTLISDQSQFDTPRKAGDPEIPKGLNPQQVRGMKLFLDAHCATCHKGPTLSSAANPSIYNVPGPDKGLVIRKTLNGAFTSSGVVFGMMDEGFFNTSVTPTSYDLGVGGNDPFGNPLAFSTQYMQTLLTHKKMVDPLIVKACNLDNPFAKDYKASELITDVIGKQGCGGRSVYAKLPKASVLLAEMKKKEQGRALVAVKGAFKIPSLRNVELTAPYMHNGSMLTLEQVVDFYFRGGNFNNPHHFATLVFPQGISTAERADLVAFLKSLTDERVRWEKAPFDHPQILIPHGHAGTANSQNLTLAKDNFLNVPAVGKSGRSRLLGPVKPFQSYLGR
ncbi:cytochrome-c peroxidase [Crenothrix sp.]|uniref:cytochrome-c peroxidase n=1 Tax=Crenothrix sp. TaxID=3100433 RepID=UPI00374D7DE9